MATVKRKKFRAVKFRFSTDEGMHYERYMIINNHIPYFRINQWLELKSIKKMSTGKEYAMKLAVFLNWLDDHSTSFEAATNHHVRQFLQLMSLSWWFKEEASGMRGFSRRGLGRISRD